LVQPGIPVGECGGGQQKQAQSDGQAHVGLPFFLGGVLENIDGRSFSRLKKPEIAALTGFSAAAELGKLQPPKLFSDIGR